VPPGGSRALGGALQARSGRSNDIRRGRRRSCQQLPDRGQLVHRSPMHHRPCWYLRRRITRAQAQVPSGSRTSVSVSSGLVEPTTASAAWRAGSQDRGHRPVIRQLIRDACPPTDLRHLNTRVAEVSESPVRILMQKSASPFVISNAVGDTWLSTGIHPLRGPAEYERLANWLAGGGQRARPTSSGAISPLSCLKDRPALQEVSVSRPAAGANHLRSREPGVVQPSHGWGAAVGRCVCRAGWPLGRLLPQAAVFWATGSRGAPEWTAASEMALLGPQDFRRL
jgi:hypothetical protein